MLIIDEALSQLLDDLLLRISLIKQLDVLSSCNLSLPHDPLLVLHELGFVIVNEGIVLAYLPHDVIYLLFCYEDQEGFLNVEVLFLNVSGNSQVIVLLIGNEEELLDKC